MLDTERTFTSWEDDVKQTLLSLVVHRLPNGTQPYMTTVTQMRGVLGPVLLAGRNDRERMRVVHWTADEQPRVTMLLPDNYVRIVLEDYNIHARTSHGRALLATQGFYALHRADEVPLVFEYLTEAELDSERCKHGPRLWIHSKARVVPMMAELPQVPTRDAVVYRTQLEADRKSLGRGIDGGVEALPPGKRVVADATTQFFFVSTSSEDPFCGLRVCWAGNEGSPVLSVDTRAQSPYESCE